MAGLYGKRLSSQAWGEQEPARFEEQSTSGIIVAFHEPPRTARYVHGRREAVSVSLNWPRKPSPCPSEHSLDDGLAKSRSKKPGRTSRLLTRRLSTWALSCFGKFQTHCLHPPPFSSSFFLSGDGSSCITGSSSHQIWSCLSTLSPYRSVMASDILSGTCSVLVSFFASRGAPGRHYSPASLPACCFFSSSLRCCASLSNTKDSLPEAAFLLLKEKDVYSSSFQSPSVLLRDHRRGASTKRGTVERHSPSCLSSSLLLSPYAVALHSMLGSCREKMGTWTRSGGQQEKIVRNKCACSPRCLASTVVFLHVVVDVFLGVLLMVSICVGCVWRLLRNISSNTSFQLSSRSRSIASPVSPSCLPLGERIVRQTRPDSSSAEAPVSFRPAPSWLSPKRSCCHGLFSVLPFLLLSLAPYVCGHSHPRILPTSATLFNAYASTEAPRDARRAFAVVPLEREPFRYQRADPRVACNRGLAYNASSLLNIWPALSLEESLPCSGSVDSASLFMEGGPAGDTSGFESDWGASLQKVRRRSWERGQVIPCFLRPAVTSLTLFEKNNRVRKRSLGEFLGPCFISPFPNLRFTGSGSSLPALRSEDENKVASFSQVFSSSFSTVRWRASSSPVGPSRLVSSPLSSADCGSSGRHPNYPLFTSYSPQASSIFNPARALFQLPPRVSRTWVSRMNPKFPSYRSAESGTARLSTGNADLGGESEGFGEQRGEPEGQRDRMLRNVAIIAHVDHGKTTLVDALLLHAAELECAGDLRTSWDLEKKKSMQRMMDSGQLEKERGITITAKVCSLRFKDGRKINIIDTPGHADFSGEVERVMHLADGVLLVVDAVEGCKPQTRVVLQKALKANLRAVVVINKVDRSAARPEDVAAQVFDLFLHLDATEEQADFEVVYASALNRRSGGSPRELVGSMEPIIDAIMRLPPPRSGHTGTFTRAVASALTTGNEATTAPLSQAHERGVPPLLTGGGSGALTPLQMQVAHVDYNAYRGNMAMGKLLSGSLVPGMLVGVQKPGEPVRKATFSGVFEYNGMDLRELDFGNLATDSASSPSGASSADSGAGLMTSGVADASLGGSGSTAQSTCATKVVNPTALVGDIVVLAGLTTDVRVGDSIVDLQNPRPLPPLAVAEPSVSIQVMVNTSPLAGKEVDSPTTGTVLRERLLKMAQRDVSLRVDVADETSHQLSGSSCLLRLSGRGPLHLTLVVEALRREGMELVVAAPSVLPKWSDDGELLEPVEEMEVTVPQEHAGVVINEVKQRKGDLVDLTTPSSPTSPATLIFRIPTRKSFGLRASILTASKGTASVHAASGGYQPVPTGEDTDGLLKIARNVDGRGVGSSNADKKTAPANKGCNALIPKEGAKKSAVFDVKRGIEGSGAKRRDRGFLVATEDGTVTAKGALSAQERGQLFVTPGDQVYGGMIVGLNSRGGDLPINVCKAKKLTNMRAAHKDVAEGIVPSFDVTLDYGLEVLGANEVMEVTPKSIRLAIRSAMRR
ncbi:elongation factor tu gtp binding domain-containing protein [Cystoisospora suis]|uniref:Elongation factor tu gtp binding domain-containing protein n=1 Tax=Cystoisospora suis TaxID=483139 RepID=A0A2C6KZY0_9APIC|nr:elongation factor tu gtp binding domain-containing protein [Cystoisospora suis]